MLAVVHARGRVGRLQTGAEGLAFTYHRQWLDSSGAFPLSPRLPLREAAWEGMEVAVFFANLLPEGALLETLLKLRRIPPANLYRQLEAFGRESAGAFAIVPEGDADALTEATATWQPYARDALVEDLARMRDQVPLLSRHAQLRLSLAGAQNKIPVRWADGALWLPQDGAASTHILKPALQPQRLFPDAVHNEAFCLRLAAAVGLPVPAGACHDTAGGPRANAADPALRPRGAWRKHHAPAPARRLPAHRHHAGAEIRSGRRAGFCRLLRHARYL